jgi:hypothetical protein
MKLCSKCDQLKEETAFHVRIASADGLAFKCKDCVNQYSRAWRLENPDAHKQWYQSNKESKSKYWATWYQNNQDRKSASYKKWVARNKHKKNTLVSKRVAARKSAVASWIDFDAVRKIYSEALRMTELTGIRHEVDHIVPLQGKLVSGLHWEGNLQVITKTENARKANSFDVSKSA